MSDRSVNPVISTSETAANDGQFLNPHTSTEKGEKPPQNVVLQEEKGDADVSSSAKFEALQDVSKSETVGRLKSFILPSEGEEGARLSKEVKDDRIAEIPDRDFSPILLSPSSRSDGVKPKQRGSFQQSASDTSLPEASTEGNSPPVRTSSSCHEGKSHHEGHRKKLMALRHSVAEKQERLASPGKDHKSLENLETRKGGDEVVCEEVNEANNALSGVTLKEFAANPTCSYVLKCSDSYPINVTYSEKEKDALKFSTSGDSFRSREVTPRCRSNERDVGGQERCSTNPCDKDSQASEECFVPRVRKKWDTPRSQDTYILTSSESRRPRKRSESRSFEEINPDLKNKIACQRTRWESDTRVNLSGGSFTDREGVSNASASHGQGLATEGKVRTPLFAKLYSHESNSFRTKVDKRNHIKNKPLPSAQAKTSPRNSSSETTVQKPCSQFMQIRQIQNRLKNIGEATHCIGDMIGQLAYSLSMLNFDFRGSEEKLDSFLQSSPAEPKQNFFGTFQDAFSRKVDGKLSGNKMDEGQFQFTFNNSGLQSSGNLSSTDVSGTVPTCSGSEDQTNPEVSPGFISGKFLLKSDRFDTYVERFLSRMKPTQDAKCDDVEQKLHEPAQRSDYKDSKMGVDCMAGSKCAFLGDVNNQNRSTDITSQPSTSVKTFIESGSLSKAHSDILSADLKEMLIHDSGDCKSEEGGEGVVIIDDMIGKNDCTERCKALNENSPRNEEDKNFTVNQDRQVTVGEGGDVPPFSLEDFDVSRKSAVSSERSVPHQSEESMSGKYDDDVDANHASNGSETLIHPSSPVSQADPQNEKDFYSDWLRGEILAYKCAVDSALNFFTKGTCVGGSKTSTSGEATIRDELSTVPISEELNECKREETSKTSVESDTGQGIGNLEAVCEDSLTVSVKNEVKDPEETDSMSDMKDE